MEAAVLCGSSLQREEVDHVQLSGQNNGERLSFSSNLQEEKWIETQRGIQRG